MMKLRLLGATIVLLLIFAACHSKSSNEKGTNTPEELAKRVLDAFKENDFDSYQACIATGTPEKKKESFEFVRKELESRGLTDWSKVTFSRVTYGHDHAGKGGLSMFRIEFEYGSDYWGAFSLNGADEINGKYFLSHAYDNAGMVRK